MKESVTRTTKELRDHSQIILRKICEIADSVLPSIKIALEQSIQKKSDFREAIQNYVKSNKWVFRDTYKELFGEDSVNLTVDMDLISQIPFSVLLSALGSDLQRSTLKAIDAASYRSNGSPQWLAQGEIRVELSTIRVALLTTSEIFNTSIYVPTVEVGPQVNFAFNNRRDNNGALQHNWLPNPENISPVGSFAQVNSIDFGVLIDLDTAVKAYWASQKSDGIPQSPEQGMTGDEEKIAPEFRENEFINRSVSSIILTYLANVSRSIGLYSTALNELINPLTNILDEAFLEYADLDTPSYKLIDRKVSEPHWIRFNISKASALIDASIRGLNATNGVGGDSRYNVFSSAMGALIRGFFYHKYKLRNLREVQLESVTMTLTRLSEKMFEQIDRAKDPLAFQEFASMLENANKAPHLYFQDRDQISGLAAAQRNGVLLIQKTMVLIAYSSLMIHAESGLDNKYNQFNNFFGRKGGYKGIVKKLVYVLQRHMKDLFGTIADSPDSGMVIPIFRWKKDKEDEEKKLIDLCTDITNLVPWENKKNISQMIVDFNMAFYNTLQLPFYPHYDELDSSLRAVLSLMNSSQEMHDENGENDGPGLSPETKLPLENYVRPFFGHSNQNASGQDNHTLSGKTLEQFNASIDDLISSSESQDFCVGMVSPVAEMLQDADGLENEITIQSGRIYEEGDPAAEENQAYIQKAEESLTRFEDTLLKMLRKANPKSVA